MYAIRSYYAGDVGRRNHDAVGIALTGGSEVVVRLPLLVPVLFDLVGLVSLVHGGPYLWKTDGRQSAPVCRETAGAGACTNATKAGRAAGWIETGHYTVCRLSATASEQCLSPAAAGTGESEG